MSGKRGSALFGYGMAMDIHNDGQAFDDSSQSSSINSIKDRINGIQMKDLNSHVAEYDAIHEDLERALKAIDGL